MILRWNANTPGQLVIDFDSGFSGIFSMESDAEATDLRSLLRDERVLSSFAWQEAIKL